MALLNLPLVQPHKISPFITGQKLRFNSRKLRAARKKELHYLYKFAELGQLSTALFHDLANNVAVLTLDLEQLQRRRDRHALERANNSLSHIEKLVEEMRRQLNQTDSPTDFRPNRAINQVAASLKGRFEAAHTRLRLINKQPAEARIFGDKARFAQLITVLLVNALDATIQAAATTNLTDRLVLVELSAHNRFLVITVSDWGAGINPALQAEIFKPFFGTKPGGMGVGLFITKQIIETHFSGSIELQNNDNPTQFTVRIPLSKSATKRTAKR